MEGAKMVGAKTEGKARTEAEELNYALGDSLIGDIVVVLKKVSDEEVKYQQAFYKGNGFEVTALRFITGYYGNTYVWFEIVIVYVDVLDVQKYKEILTSIQGWKAFRYYKGYDEFYGRLVYIIPNKVKGIFKPKLVTKKAVYSPWAVKSFERTLYVVLNPKVGKDKTIASAYAYLVNYFANRALRLESTLTSTSGRLNIWRRVRMIFHGKANGKEASLSRSLYALYNNIYYRAEFLEEQRRLSEPIAKTMKLLADLFYTFAKMFDKYASKVYATVVTKVLFEIMKSRVGFSKVPKFAKNVVAYWNIVFDKILNSEAEKVLG